MIDKEKQYKTRDGREVRIYATDGDTELPIHGAIKTKRGWEHYGWTQNGSGILEPSDLIEVKPRIKRVYWVNIDKKGEILCWYYTKNKADIDRGSLTKSCVKVVIDCEEGEGL